MADGWQGIVVPSKLYGILQTEAPVLYIGPQSTDTVEQILEHEAGKTLPNGCGGSQVVQALKELSSPTFRKSRLLDINGADRIARFVTGSAVEESFLATESRRPRDSIPSARKTLSTRPRKQPLRAKSADR